mmetsp:Transcript_78145/g.253603  ORF Transcript_78145/g.253603 Transcript_78145/m.253603 type:complete len:223 (-) Transcript_78145:7-675(-)
MALQLCQRTHDLLRRRRNRAKGSPLVEVPSKLIQFALDSLETPLEGILNTPQTQRQGKHSIHPSVLEFDLLTVVLFVFVRARSIFTRSLRVPTQSTCTRTRRRCFQRRGLNPQILFVFVRARSIFTRSLRVPTQSTWTRTRRRCFQRRGLNPQILRSSHRPCPRHPQLRRMPVVHVGPDLYTPLAPRLLCHGGMPEAAKQPSPDGNRRRCARPASVLEPKCS